ncbi:MAG: hypothetical protein DRQ78_07520 [Epsilonproteobacteria bacterium]|nr:MAG: hypothetical protein DRQ78_07520 [Campylobacterota bacterium]
MNLKECIDHWNETGDTIFEAYVGMDIVEMQIDNVTGDPEITINDTGIDLEPEDIDSWNRY